MANSNKSHIMCVEGLVMIYTGYEWTISMFEGRDDIVEITQ